MKPSSNRQLTYPRNSELKEYIAAGVSKAEFMRRISASLTAPQPAPVQTTPPHSSELPRSEPTPAPATSTSLPSHPDGSSTSSSGQATPPSPGGSRVQEAITEKDVRPAEKAKAEEETAKLGRVDKGKGLADAGVAAKKTDAQSRHAEALKKKQREAREERQRILKAIESDKVARKAQKAEAESERRASLASEHAESARQTLASLRRVSTSRDSEHCAIQVRLLDGSTIRDRFNSDQTLKDVREWVDGKQEGKEPYTFKVLLTPLPSKKIDATEEDKSLQALELAPSSTLILVRVPRFTAAFTAAAPAGGGAVQGNVFQRFIGYILALITGFLGTISGFFSTFLGLNHSPAGSEPSSGRTSQSQAAADATRRRGRIAGVDSTNGPRNEQQFYNGNSVSARLS